VHPPWWRHLPRALRRTLTHLPHPSAVMDTDLPILATDDAALLALLPQSLDGLE
jgi:hypothetical protein